MLKKLRGYVCFVLVLTLVITTYITKPFNSNANQTDVTTDTVSTDYTNITDDLECNLVTLSSTNEVEDYILNKNAAYEETGTNENNSVQISEETSAPSDSLPSVVDNSATKYFPPIGNQYYVSSCVSYATVYYQMTYAVNKALDRSANTNNNIMSPSFTYNLTSKGLNTGSYYTDLLKVLSEIGCVSLADMPLYKIPFKSNLVNIPANRETWLEASKYRVKEYYTIGSEIDTDVQDPSKTVYTNEDISAIKKALAMGEVLTCSTMPERWKRSCISDKVGGSANAKYKNEIIISRVNGAQSGTHRITLVGYDDDICCDINRNGTIEPEEKGAFKIANSWGKGEDNDGFIWMSYNALNINSTIDTKDPKYKTVGFYNIVGYNVDVDNTDDDCYAVIDVQTKNLEGMEVVITATDANGVKHTYNPAPFANSLKNGLGYYGFSKKKGGDRGSFYIDLTGAIKGLTRSDFNKYKWSIKITDGSKYKEMIIHSVNIYTKSNDTLSNPINTEPITLNYNSITLSIN